MIMNFIHAMALFCCQISENIGIETSLPCLSKCWSRYRSNIKNDEHI